MRDQSAVSGRAGGRARGARGKGEKKGSESPKSGTKM